VQGVLAAGRESRRAQGHDEGRNALLELRVLRLGLPQDGDVGVGVFPERDEILIAHFDFGCVIRDSHARAFCRCLSHRPLLPGTSQCGQAAAQVTLETHILCRNAISLAGRK